MVLRAMARPGNVTRSNGIDLGAKPDFPFPIFRQCALPLLSQTVTHISASSLSSSQAAIIACSAVAAIAIAIALLSWHSPHYFVYESVDDGITGSALERAKRIPSRPTPIHHLAEPSTKSFSKRLAIAAFTTLMSQFDPTERYCCYYQDWVLRFLHIMVLAVACAAPAHSLVSRGPASHSQRERAPRPREHEARDS
jgi:hypothetical protein